jgi:hypothetical protein
MKTQKSLIVKSGISEIKKICEERGINYEIAQSFSKKQFQQKSKPRVKLSDQELKESFQKLTKSKNYEKEMKL